MEIICPFCGKSDLSFKLFGYPSQEMEVLAETGKFLLGGCIPSKDKWYCNECGKLFQDLSKFPCGYCSNCNKFLAPKHVSITQDGETTIKTCLNCGSIL